MSGCRVRGLWAACGLALVCWGSVRAETAAGTAIAKLLEVGWSIAPQARVAADLQWSEVQRLAGSDVRAIEASWLVLMQQRRFDEALKRLDEHLAKSPDDFDALRAKAWVQTVLKNYAVAFVTADRLSVLLSKNRPTTEEGEVEHEEAIAFLGRLIGFYGGPAADLINQEERKSREKKWLDRLDESNKVVFEDARNGVLARYIDMTDESANAKERAIATAKAEKDKSLAELQIEGGKLDEKAKELEEKRNKLNSEFKAEMDAISRQDQPLFAQQSQLATQASALETNLITLSAQISALQQLATNERNEALQQQYFAQLNSLSILASRTDADLFAVNRSLGNVQAQRNGLQTRRVQVQASAAAQVNRLDRELAEIGQRERRNEAMEKRANRPVTTTSSKVRSLSAQASALSTYDTYPLEAAKEKLLRAVR
jgi:hypothetical protein